MGGRLTPVSRRELVRRLLRLGFEGPYTGGRYEFVVRQDRRLILPNPHRGDIGVALLSRILDEAGIRASLNSAFKRSGVWKAEAF